MALAGYLPRWPTVILAHLVLLGFLSGQQSVTAESLLGHFSMRLNSIPWEENNFQRGWPFLFHSEESSWWTTPRVYFSSPALIFNYCLGALLIVAASAVVELWLRRQQWKQQFSLRHLFAGVTAAAFVIRFLCAVDWQRMPYSPFITVVSKCEIFVLFAMAITFSSTLDIVQSMLLRSDLWPNCFERRIHFWPRLPRWPTALFALCAASGFVVGQLSPYPTESLLTRTAIRSHVPWSLDEFRNDAEFASNVPWSFDGVIPLERGWPFTFESDRDFDVYFSKYFFVINCVFGGLLIGGASCTVERFCRQCLNPTNMSVLGLIKVVTCISLVVFVARLPSPMFLASELEIFVIFAIPLAILAAFSAYNGSGVRLP